MTKSVTLCMFFFQIVKIDGGDYGNFGTGTNVDVQKPFLLFANRSCCKVLAASIYWHDSQQEYVEVGQRLVIPLNYPGNLWNSTILLTISVTKYESLILRLSVPSLGCVIR